MATGCERFLLHFHHFNSSAIFLDECIIFPFPPLLCTIERREAFVC